MPWWTELAAWVPALVAIIAAWWQFAGTRDRNEAQAVASMEAAVASAAERADPIAHAYRAHALKGLQSKQRTKPAAGFATVMWATMTVTIMGLLFTVERGFYTTTVVLGIGMMASAMLAMRNYAIWHQAARILDLQLGEALEISMVNERKAFIAATAKEDPRPNAPSLGPQVREWYRRQNSSQRFKTAAITVAIFFWIVLYWVLKWFPGNEFPDIQVWMNGLAWWCAIISIFLTIGSRSLKKVARGQSSTWAQGYIRVGSPLAWALFVVVIGRKWLAAAFIAILEYDAPVAASDIIGWSSGVVAVSLLVSALLWRDRLQSRGSVPESASTTAASRSAGP